MKEYTRKLFEKALDAIEAAEALSDVGKAEFAAGRAYYAMFYIAEALLGEKGFEFSQHGQVIGAYGSHFADMISHAKDFLADAKIYIDRQGE